MAELLAWDAVHTSAIRSSLARCWRAEAVGKVAQPLVAAGGDGGASRAHARRTPVVTQRA